MIRQSREERKIRAMMIAEYRANERLRYIDWQMDVLEKRVNEFLERAQLPERPSDLGISVHFSSQTEKPRAKSRRKKSS